MRKGLSLFVLVMALVVVFAGAVSAAEYDLGGKTVYFVSWCDRVKEVEDKFPGRVAEAEKLFNCKIEAKGLPGDTYAEGLMNRLLAGESTHDVWNISHDYFWQLMPQDAFYPVSEFLSEDYYSSLPDEHQNTMKTLSYQGKKYGFSAFGTIFGAMRFVLFNKDMIERLGLTSPYELYENGNWTWETAEEIAKKATLDTDGDGEIDQYGWGNVWRYDMVLSNGGRLTREVDGKRVVTLDEERSLEAFSKYYQWTQVDKIVEVGDWGGNNFRDGKYAMQPLEVWRIGFLRDGMDFEFGIVPFPKGPKADRYQYPQLSMETWALPSNAEDREALVALADFLWRTEDYNMKAEVLRTAPDKTAAKVLWEGLTTWDGDILMLTSIIPDEYGDAIAAIDSGEKTPAAAIAEVIGKMQANLNDLFGYED